MTDLPAGRPRALIPSAVRCGEKRVCELPKASKALYCEYRRAASSARERSSAELTGLAAEVRLSSKGTCGSPRAHAELRRRGVACWRWRVARLMRQHGLEGGRNRRRKKTISDCAKQSTMDPIKHHFSPNPCIDRRHAGHRTSIRSCRGFASLATIVDLASRRVVCWATEWERPERCTADVPEFAVPHVTFVLLITAGLAVTHNPRDGSVVSAPIAAARRDGAGASGFRRSMARRLGDSPAL